MPSELASSSIVSVALVFGYALLGLSLLCAFIRLAKGPSSADRVIALDLIAGIALAATILLSLETGRNVYLNVAVCLAIIAFLGSVAFARYLEKRPHEKWNT